ncbi:unnamed protein product [Brassica oleracea]|uniref:Uncharacterized protein n=2 Tax=Brassica TaxID=3705 RepID=A0A3P6D0Z2_BRAOL|nr:unnamed protein product [Brassica napus]VDD19588.1 unnamed protein product [Brassica oleracea]
MDSEYQTMEQFLRWAGELGVSDSTDPSRSHHSCLGHYGFTLEVNSNDKVFIPLEISLYALASSWPKDSLYIHQDEKCGSVLKDLPTSLLEDVILEDIDKLQDPELRQEQREV